MNELKCDFCGLDEKQVQNNGWLGCVRCYEIFPVHTNESGSLEMKAELQGGMRKTRTYSLNILHEEMQRAVFMEEYELAAALRDKIQKLLHPQSSE